MISKSTSLHDMRLAYYEILRCQQHCSPDEETDHAPIDNLLPTGIMDLPHIHRSLEPYADLSIGKISQEEQRNCGIKKEYNDETEQRSHVMENILVYAVSGVQAHPKQPGIADNCQLSLDEMVESIPGATKWRCRLCDSRLYSGSHEAKRHAASTHLHESVRCPLAHDPSCKGRQSFTRSDALKSHYLRRHQDVPREVFRDALFSMTLKGGKRKRNAVMRWVNNDSEHRNKECEAQRPRNSHDVVLQQSGHARQHDFDEQDIPNPFDVTFEQYLNIEPREGPFSANPQQDFSVLQYCTTMECSKRSIGVVFSHHIVILNRTMTFTKRLSSMVL
ncbi:hypothetical protein EDC01DRAFT_635300 [Geopyxis carbonaria]|nr:hypothetical protein EDC01DRAFT_635300 [Geopyxis carbonaria]